MAEEAFVCPFCGAPHRTLIPAGVVQVRCQYCGTTVLVPPRLGGVVQRCPNHPSVLAVSLCTDCGKSYCDRCLYVYRVRDGRLHLCSRCYDSRNSAKHAGGFLLLALSILFFLLFFGLSARAIAERGVIPLPALGVAFSLLISSLLLLIKAEKKPLSVRDAPRKFLKKCIKCDEEIPIASEECQYCRAKQPEYVEP